MDSTDFAHRMKMYEKKETREKLNPNLPIVVRLDGRGFSKFTKPFKRPYDEDFREVMVATAKHVMEKCGGCLAYTQSDEISILIDRKDVFFNAKKQKVVSVLAAMATSKFVIEAMKKWPEHVSETTPHFDARAFNVPDYNEAVNSIYWRQVDCVRNSVSMVGHYYLSRSDMHKKKTTEVISMLGLRKDVNWYDYPNEFRYGVYIYRKQVTMPIEDEVWAKIPDKNKPESREAQRNVTIVDSFDNPSFEHIKNISLGVDV